jgi:hypothetical protein
MKVCVLMSGLPRLVISAVNKFYSQLNHFNNSEIHFYGYFWGGESKTIATLLENIFSEKSRIWFEDGFEDDIAIRKKAPETIVNNVLSMFMARKKLMAACNSHNVFKDGAYDIYIYTRSDSCLSGDLDVRKILKKLDKYDLLVPKNGHWREGINDQFAIGKSAAIKIYLDVYTNLNKYIVDDVLFHPETLLKYHLRANGIKVGYLELDNYLFRSENLIINNTCDAKKQISIFRLLKIINKIVFKRIGFK